MTKFLNISTDTTLGGSSASDDTVSSQKAVKSYVDNHSVTTTSSVTSGSSAALTSGGAYTNLVRRLSTSAATGSASQGVYVDANGQVQTCTAVTSTYAATGTAPVNGTAVSNAIAVKQDTLVSGTNIKTINGSSLLGSGNITIETSSTPNVDGETVSYNSSDALQAIAVKNVRDGSTLPIWHGTEYQWNHGAPTTWYYWQTNVMAMWTSGGAMPSSGSWRIAFGDGRFVAVTTNSSKSAYSTDGGITWQSGGNLSSSTTKASLAFGNGRFVVTPERSLGTEYSTDGGVTWQSGGNLPSSGDWYLGFGNNRFIAVKYGSNESAYSTDGGVTWQSGGNLHSSGDWFSIAYGNDRFVVTANSGNESAYSTDGGVTWQSGGNLPSSGQWRMDFGSNRFIAVKVNDSVSAYSSDGGVTWQSGGNLPSYGQWIFVRFGNGIFVTFQMGNNVSAYSTDGGVTWQSGGNLPSSGYWVAIAFGDDKFVVIKYNSTDTAIFSVTYDKCYTDMANPTTTSTVYSAPDTASSYTISSVTSGAITLSNNNTYYYNQSGNTQTYDTVGNSHPEYLCSINGLGVKIGNTLIADAGIAYGESDSAEDAAQKEVTISSITSLNVGQIIIVKPTITSTVADSTLKLNNFNAYPMRYGAAAITTSTDSIVWSANYPSWFRFDGNYWVFLGHGVDNNTTYSAMSVSEGTTGTATSSRVMRADRLKSIIQGTKLTGLSTSTNSAVVATDTILVAIGKLQAQINNILNNM